MAEARGEVANIGPAGVMDRWLYIHNEFGPADRQQSSVFGVVGDPESDNRIAQMLLGFNTAAANVPANRGAANYSVTRATIRVIDSQGGYAYDPTYDSIASYQTGATDDPGRPIEIHGLGFRGGYSRLGFGASDDLPPAFEEATPVFYTGPKTRIVYPLGFHPTTHQPRDVANNVADGFESRPWAVGTVASLAPGASVPASTEYVFQLDVSDPDVQAYLRQSLNDGSLGLMVSSLLSGSIMDSSSIPQFINKEADPIGLTSGPRLELEYTVPEPSSAAVASGAAAAGLLARRRRAPRGGR